MADNAFHSLGKSPKKLNDVNSEERIHFPSLNIGIVALPGFRLLLQLRGSGGFSPRFPCTEIR